MKNVCSHNYIISPGYVSYDCHNSRLDQRGQAGPTMNNNTQSFKLTY